MATPNYYRHLTAITKAVEQGRDADAEALIERMDSQEIDNLAFTAKMIESFADKILAGRGL